MSNIRVLPGRDRHVLDLPDPAELVDQDERDSLVLLRQTVVRPEQFEDVRLAAELCPSGAITVTEDGAAGTGA